MDDASVRLQLAPVEMKCSPNCGHAAAAYSGAHHTISHTLDALWCECRMTCGFRPLFTCAAACDALNADRSEGLELPATLKCAVPGETHAGISS